MRAKRTPQPGNPTGAHRDLSIISKENGLSNTSCTRRTQWNLPTPMLKRTHTLSDRKGHYAFYLKVICYPKTKENNKNTTTSSSFPAPTYTQRQWRLEKILITLKILAMVYCDHLLVTTGRAQKHFIWFLDCVSFLSWTLWIISQYSQ